MARTVQGGVVRPADPNARVYPAEVELIQFDQAPAFGDLPDNAQGILYLKGNGAYFAIYPGMFLWYGDSNNNNFRVLYVEAMWGPTKYTVRAR